MRILPDHPRETMPARFRIRRVFRVHGRDGVVISGNIESGIVRRGMTARIWIDGGLYWSIPITSVDFLDVDRAAGIAEVALWLDVNDEVDEGHGSGFEDLTALCREGDAIYIQDAAAE